MKKIFLQSFIVLALTIFAYLPTYAQFNPILVKVTDESGTVLTGSSNTVGFSGQTEILDFGQESSACALTFGGQSSCNAVTGNFVYSFTSDPTITDYRKALYQRRLWRKVEISFLRTGPNGTQLVYEKITLEDVYVTNLIESAVGDGQQFQVHLDPTKITWTFTPQLPNGQAGTPRSFGYNRQTNTSF